MARQVSVPEAGVKYLIQQAYDAGGQYQWARETLVNALQAHATWVQFGVERQLVEHRGTAKRYVADNGIGMSADELRDYMSSFGGGGRPISKGENFGQGQKSSSYPWNGYGLVVLSWTPESPNGNGIWIHRDNKGDFVLREWDIEHEDGEIYLDDVFEPGWDDELGIDLSLDGLNLPEIRKAGHGTVFLFLGESLADETVGGDKTKGEHSHRGIAAYLNSRFIDLPPGVKVTVMSFEEGTAHEVLKLVRPNGEAGYLRARNIRGLKSFLPALEASGTMKVQHGTEIDWYLCKTDKVPGGGSYGPFKSMITVEYPSLFEGVRFTEAYERFDSLRQYQNFGIGSLDVARRLWLIIRPPAFTEGSPEWGVIPQASRGALLAKGGGPLPIEAWGEEFYQNMPQEIRDALDAARANQPEGEHRLNTRLKEKLARLSMRMRPNRLLTAQRGVSGVPSTAGTGKSIRRGGHRSASDSAHGVRSSHNPTGAEGEIPLLNKGQGEATGQETRRGDGLPSCQWVDRAVWEAYDAGPMIAAHWNDRTNSITINSSYPMFAGEFTYWQNSYPKASPADVDEIVKDAYETELITKVVHVKSLRGPTFSNAEAQRLLSDEALTVSVLGLLNVEAAIRTVAGGKFGRRQGAE